MPGFGDSAFIVILALLLFGPKKLPVLARQLGKLMADFRRASNEFRAQMEEELRIAEQADRQKEVAALEASSTNTIAPPSEPHTPPAAPNFATPAEGEIAPDSTEFTPTDDTRYPETTSVIDSHATSEQAPAPTATAETEDATPPTPIATSGDLNMMPPETGLPIARSPRSMPDEHPTGPTSTETLNANARVDAAAESSAHETELETQTLHG